MGIQKDFLAWLLMGCGVSCASEPLPSEQGKTTSDEVIVLDPHALKSFQEKQALRRNADALQQPTPASERAREPRVVAGEALIKKQLHQQVFTQRAAETTVKHTPGSLRDVHGKAPDWAPSAHKSGESKP